MSNSALSKIPESYPSHLHLHRNQKEDAIQTRLQFPETLPLGSLSSNVIATAQHTLVSVIDDDSENNMPSIPHYTGPVREMPERSSIYVYDFLQIFYQKVEEFAQSNGVNSLNEADNDICFEQACSEFNKMYPGFEKNNARVFELAREHI